MRGYRLLSERGRRALATICDTLIPALEVEAYESKRNSRTDGERLRSLENALAPQIDHEHLALASGVGYRGSAA